MQSECSASYLTLLSFSKTALTVQVYLISVSSSEVPENDVWETYAYKILTYYKNKMNVRRYINSDDI